MKCKSHFWPSLNTTEKIEFVSQVVQTFGLLLFGSPWNFASVIIFEVQTAGARCVWLPIMCRLLELTGSNWALQKMQNFGNHTIETKMLYIYTKSNYIETISLFVMVPEILNFLDSSNWTGQYSQPTHYRWPNSTCARGLNLKYYTAKVSWTSEQ